MRIAIDASNLNTGGTKTHLMEFLNHLDPLAGKISSVIVYGSQQTLQQLPSKPWLTKSVESSLNAGLLRRSLWQIFGIDRSLKRDRCDVLLVPGGFYLGKFRPFVTMSRNMLVFDKKQRALYFPSWMYLRLCILERLQRNTFERADGLIFLSKYAETSVTAELHRHLVPPKSNRIIHHGVAKKFEEPPRPQLEVKTAFSRENPYCLLYISSIEVYKYQWNVAEAVCKLIAEGYPLELNLVGSLYKPSYKKLKKVLARYPQQASAVRVHGVLDYQKISGLYKSSHLFVYASTCENMPNILMEAMRSGLPIVCSSLPPMPEFIEDAAEFMNPTSIESIQSALKKVLDSSERRTEISRKSFERSQNFSWEKCSRETASYLRQVASAYKAVT